MVDLNLNDAYDLVILGGGLAGLTLARQLGLERPGTSILVVEQASHPCPESAHKVGESSVELAGRWLRDTLQLKDHLDEQHLPKLGLRYFLPGDKHDITSRLEYGPLLNKVPVPFRGLLVPSYQLDRGRLETFLAEDLPETTHFRDGAAVLDFSLDGAGHTVTVQGGDEQATVQARWIVDASGRQALLKTKLGLAEPTEHHINSVWWRVEGRIKVDDWSDDPEWCSRIKAPIRWQSTCQLLGTGYWIWIISLAPNRTSVGIVADPRIHPFKTMNRSSRAIAWLDEHEPLLADAMRGREVCDFMALRDFSRNSRQVFSADRWGMTGDAGLFSDPFYSPGSDFIAIANTYNLDLIKGELDGEDITERVERANYFFKLLYDQFMRVYRDHYVTMGNPQVMAAKMVFDNAFYWGWAVLAFQNGRLCDTDFMHGFHAEVLRSISLHGRVEELLREWNAAEQPDVAPGQYIDQFDVKMLWSIYTTLIRPIDGDVLKRRMSENLDRLEALAEVIFRRATRGNPRVEAAEHINCHLITLDESKWDELGLFDAPDKSGSVERVRKQAIPLWVDGSVDAALRDSLISKPDGPEAALVPQAAPAPLEDGGTFGAFSD